MSARGKLQDIIRTARAAQAAQTPCVQVFHAVMVALENLNADMAVAEATAHRVKEVYNPAIIPTLKPNTINVAKIIDEVADAHGLTTALLIGPARQKHIAAARHEAMWRIRNETGATLQLIGRFFGGRDHTTVQHGVRKYDAALENGSRT
jgi:chromosomal replication initiator protein